MLSSLEQRPASFEEYCHWARNNPGDLNEHWGLLRSLASQVAQVTEFGVRHGISTSALLAGTPKTLTCYDWMRQPEVEWLEEWSRLGGQTEFTFHEANVLEVIITPTDMLFIDTLHVYEQLRAELAQHAGQVRRWIVLHDTEVPPGEGNDAAGMWRAITEFLVGMETTWKLLSHCRKNNGLTILERRMA